MVPEGVVGKAQKTFQSNFDDEYSQLESMGGAKDEAATDHSSKDQSIDDEKEESKTINAVLIGTRRTGEASSPQRKEAQADFRHKAHA